MSVVASIRARMINLLLIAIPDVSCELPLASDLLPHDHVLSTHLLRLLVFGHQRESPDLTSRIVAERFYIHRRELQAANSFARLGPSRCRAGADRRPPRTCSRWRQSCPC